MDGNECEDLTIFLASFPPLMVSICLTNWLLIRSPSVVSPSLFPASSGGAGIVSEFFKKDSIMSRDDSLNSTRKTKHCICTLMHAFPKTSPRKNVQKGMRKWPQAIPHMSKAAFGQAESMITATSPCRFTNLSIHSSQDPMYLEMVLFWAPVSNASSKSLFFFPTKLAE